MGTSATVRLKTKNKGEEILLHSRHDASQDAILKWAKEVESELRGDMTKLERWLSNKKNAFPLVSQWCGDWLEFLNEPDSLKKMGNMLIGTDAGHFFSSMSARSGAKYDALPDRANLIVPLYKSADYILMCESGKAPKLYPKGARDEVVCVSLLEKESPTTTIAIQWDDGTAPSASLYESDRVKEEVVLDVAMLPEFLTELSLCLRAYMSTTGIPKEKWKWDLPALNGWVTALESMRGLRSYLDNYDPNEGVRIEKSVMMSECQSMVPFNVAQTLMGKHLTFMKPGCYWPSTSVAYAEKKAPDLLFDYMASENGERMVEFGVFFLKESPESRQQSEGRAWKNARDAVVNHQKRMSRVWEIKRSGKLLKTTTPSTLKYMESLVDGLRDVAHIKSREWWSKMEGVMLKTHSGLTGHEKPSARSAL
jgi:hypothetical protein